MKVKITVLSIIFLLFASLVFYAYDNYELDHKYYNKIAYGSNCNYPLPSGYKIVYNIYIKKYAVRHTDSLFIQYLVGYGNAGIQEFLENHSPSY